MGKLAEILSHPHEIPALARMWWASYLATRLPSEPNKAFCYGMLNRVSRSFAIVIQQLPVDLRDSICVFYLVLRALDTVEDDMAIPVATKVPVLRSFFERLSDPEFKYPCGMGPYVDLMDQYPKVTAVYLTLPQKHREVIADITRRMGNGMADFIESEVVSEKDWDLYCHYVAGLVGVGLSDLFVASGLEGSEFTTDRGYALANDMGLFLQKTNIIRDYLEDICEEPAPRMFWPRDVWSKYASRLEDFKEPGNIDAAVGCLNELITSALQHARKCLTYMEGLRHPWVFRFCAIPQVMAIGTLSLCYNNPQVFKGVVKMRRGHTASLMVSLVTMVDVYGAFAGFAKDIAASCEAGGLHKTAVGQRTMATCKEILEACAKGTGKARKAPKGKGQEAVVPMALRVALLAVFGAYFAYAWGLPGLRGTLVGAVGQPSRSFALMQQALATVLLAVFGYVAVTGRRVSF